MIPAIQSESNTPDIPEQRRARVHDARQIFTVRIAEPKLTQRDHRYIVVRYFLNLLENSLTICWLGGRQPLIGQSVDFFVFVTSNKATDIVVEAWILERERTRSGAENAPAASVNRLHR